MLLLLFAFEGGSRVGRVVYGMDNPSPIALKQGIDDNYL